MTTEQLAALKEVAEKPDLKSWKQGGNYWSNRTVADTHGNTFIADCGDNARSLDVAAFIAAFDPTTCLELVEEVERLRNQWNTRFNTLCGNCGKRYLGPRDEHLHGLGMCGGTK